MLRVFASEQAPQWVFAFEFWLRKFGIVFAKGDPRDGDFGIVVDGALPSDGRRFDAGYVEVTDAASLQDHFGLAGNEVNWVACHFFGLSGPIRSMVHADETGYLPTGYRSIYTAARQANAMARGSAETPFDDVSLRAVQLEPNDRWRPILWMSTSPEGEDRSCVMVSDGRRIVSGIPVVRLLAAKHTLFELSDAYLCDGVKAPDWTFEIWFRDLLLATSAAANTRIMTIDPWPDGKTGSMTLRHDYDRAIPSRHLQQILDGYAEIGIVASFGYLARHLVKRQTAMIETQGHEVALHSEARSPEEFDSEIAQFAECTGHSPYGVTFHGGSGALGIRGSINSKWADRHDLGYVETYLKTASLHAFAAIEGESLARFNAQSLPFHLSFDAAIARPRPAFERMREGLEQMLANGLHVTLMNHPDLNAARLLAFVRGLDLDNVWLASHAEIADWSARIQEWTVQPDARGGWVLSFTRPPPPGLSICDRQGPKTERLDVETSTIHFAGHFAGAGQPN